MTLSLVEVGKILVCSLSKSDVQHLRVRLGDHNIKTDGESSHVEKRVKRVIRHKGFSSSTLVSTYLLLIQHSGEYLPASHPALW